MHKTIQCLTLILAACLPLAAAPVLSFQPGSAALAVGQAVWVDVFLTGGVDIYAYEINVGFDPAVAFAVDQLDGDYLNSGGSTFLVPGTIDNSAGTITFISGTLVGAVPGVSGDGLIARIQFKGMAPGISALTLLNVTLLDSTLFSVAADFKTGSLEVAPAVIPEPATAWLAGLALAALTAARHRLRPKTRT